MQDLSQGSVGYEIFNTGVLQYETRAERLADFIIIC